jgi:hypothetical protein
MILTDSFYAARGGFNNHLFLDRVVRFLTYRIGYV